jgi:hypothetical protein
LKETDLPNGLLPPLDILGKKDNSKDISDN